MIVHLQSYNAPPNDDAFRANDERDLRELVPEPEADPDGAVALRLLAVGFPLLTAVDEDGLYLATDLRVNLPTEAEQKSEWIGSYPLFPPRAFDDPADLVDAYCAYAENVSNATAEALAENGITFDEIRLDEFQPGEIRVYGANVPSAGVAA